MRCHIYIGNHHYDMHVTVNSLFDFILSFGVNPVCSIPEIDVGVHSGHAETDRHE